MLVTGKKKDWFIKVHYCINKLVNLEKKVLLVITNSNT